MMNKVVFYSSILFLIVFNSCIIPEVAKSGLSEGQQNVFKIPLDSSIESLMFKLVVDFVLKP